jgi:hypothetical protein
MKPCLKKVFSASAGLAHQPALSKPSTRRCVAVAAASFSQLFPSQPATRQHNTRFEQQEVEAARLGHFILHLHTFIKSFYFEVIDFQNRTI